jgi:xylulokinase
MTYLLGIDIGSSSVKASLLDISTGTCAGSAFYPKTEQKIAAPQPGFAEQDPQLWYDSAKSAIHETLRLSGVSADQIQSIGISYQMHGLVCVDKNQNVLRPSIIWCDSRAVPYGKKAFETLGSDKCLSHLLNSPGNFTAAKLAWVKDNQPEIYKKIDKIMLPGDWFAMKLTGKATTTASGLSEGIFWDFKNEAPCEFLMDYFGFNRSVLPDLVPTFGYQGELTPSAAADLGLKAGTSINYRAGDQPNNAFSLNVLKPGEIAATAGTSGVVYGVTEVKKFDAKSRVNSFVHVNHQKSQPRLGVLLCINGTGILNAWSKRLLGNPSYVEMNDLAASVPAGSDGLNILPFGNGAERMLENKNIGGHIKGLDFNRHDRSHICRAVQEGIAYSFQYGMELMGEVGIKAHTIRAGYANMFMSEIFAQTLSDVSKSTIELYETDGALGAARGAGVGCGAYKNSEEAFTNMAKIKVITPSGQDYSKYYEAWKKELHKEKI